MEKLFNVPVELFQLEKLVLNKNKTCLVEYTITDDRGDKTITHKGKDTPNYQCIIALQEKLNDLKPYLCKIRRIPETDWDNVHIKGIIWKGYGETEAFQILGTELSDSEKNMKCDSAVEHIGVDKYPFEMDIRDTILDIEEMAHAYVFEGNMSDATLGITPVALPGEDDENSEENQTEE